MNGVVRRTLVLACALLLAASIAAQTEAVGPPPEPDSTLERLDRAVLGGKWWLRLRARLENVDQDDFSRDAWATTLRTVLGYESAAWHGLSAVLEFEDVTAVGNELYDSTVNGATRYPVVADPGGSEVNQAHAKVVPAEEVVLRLGRQVLTLDNHRFVGDVGWRQNQQTFDAASVAWEAAQHLRLFYGFIDNVNRVFGEDSPQGDHRMASHLVNAGYDVSGFGRLSGYAYLLDYDTEDVLSSNTVGLRLAGKYGMAQAALLYTAEYARQTDAADNPRAVDQDYLLGKLGAEAWGFTLETGAEVLGGSGDPGDAFQTPLATLHSFNGWADKFLTTPDAGLEDYFVALSGKFHGLDAHLVWHEFQANSVGADYGTELDASLTWRACDKVVVGLKLAHYQAEDFATDTTKTWLWLAYAP